MTITVLVPTMLRNRVEEKTAKVAADKPAKVMAVNKLIVDDFPEANRYVTMSPALKFSSE